MINDSEQRFSLSLLPAPDEPPLRSPEFQGVLRGFYASLKAKGVNASVRSTTRDALNGGGWLVGVFEFTGQIVSGVVVSVLADALKTYLKDRKGRKARLKADKGGKEEEATTQEDVDQLFKVEKESRKAKQQDGDT